eukprot:6904909-Ditylum_brightwellii.AAC.1
MEKARKLVTAYFMLREIDKTTGEPTLPPQTEIEEHGLKNIYDENFDLSTSKCCIGLDMLICGTCVKTIFNASNIESDLAPPPPT